MHRDGPRPSKVQGHGSSVCPNLFIFPRKTEPWRQRWKDERWGGGREKEESSVGPEGALDFHYAKPQMESCDRVSLCATPGGAQSRLNKAPKV